MFRAVSTAPIGPNMLDLGSPNQAGLGRLLRSFFQAEWYRARYADVAASGIEPLEHFVRYGAAEQRDPNPWFDTSWYAKHYPDAVNGGSSALLHYILAGAAELRNPHAHFDAKWYVDQHPEAAGNPLLYHIRHGYALGYLTERPFDISDYLPSQASALQLPPSTRVDVVIPVYRGLEETRLCIESVLDNAESVLGRVIVVDDRSPEPALTAWLARQAKLGRITLIRNRRNLGFAESVNTGVTASADGDIVVLHNDTTVPPGWLGRLAGQAYAEPRIASVSPFSDSSRISAFSAATDESSDLDPNAIDAACQSGNRARSVELPAASGCCVFIRRQALIEIGTFEAQGSGAGYGAETDFSLRAAANGWINRLACDVFVAHKGRVSFGRRAKALEAKTEAKLRRCYPMYEKATTRYGTQYPVAPACFAVTSALFRKSGLPVILMISHNLGGGVNQHINTLLRQNRNKAHILILKGVPQGAELSVPLLPNHPIATIPSERVEDMEALLRSFGVSRAHIHHLIRMDMDIHRLIQRLNVPFDFTVHDYYSICPQINLLPLPEGFYCGEPDTASCNACISANNGANGARDILSWRREHAWQFMEAERVICPSADVKTRLERHRVGERAIVVPHEGVAEGEWPLSQPYVSGSVLRIVLLGALANHKGARAVAALAEAAPPGTIELRLIGYLEETFPQQAAKLITQTGRYREEDLPKLLRMANPHVVWLPASWPETYSYTLSIAIEAGLPIVANNLGAFTERLAGRPLTWLTDYRASTGDLLAVFDEVRTALRDRFRKPPAVPRQGIPNFYTTDYLAGGAQQAPTVVRRRTKPLVVVVPERFDNGHLSPCAYIRLLHPLDHPAIGGNIDLVLADAETALGYRADVIVTQRYALPDVASADALAAHARATGAHLVYDLDDDLLNIPRTHPDALTLRPKTKTVRRMLERADTVWLSTPELVERVGPIRPDAVLIENGLDERIWAYAQIDPGFEADPVRILCMGTSTHDRDFALIQPALVRLKEEYGDRVSIDVIGMTGQADLPSELNRIGPSIHGGRSYPAFVDWINGVWPAWHIGLAPLLDTPFNRAKSSIKAMDYAAMGLVVLASDMPVYQGSLADGPAGRLVANTPQAWFEALSWLLRAQDLRRSIAAGARAAFLATASLGSQAQARRNALRQILQ
jgi:GT2 family glycosyltransferase/glycosyltransferase involved in cell wall biosynthesis